MTAFDAIVDRVATPRGMLVLVAVAWVTAGVAIGGTQLALVRIGDQQETTSGIVDRLKKAESESSVTRVLSADQRCAFSAKSTAAHAATVGEFRAILAFVDRAGVPRSRTVELRRRAQDKEDRVSELVQYVADCRRTRNRYFVELTPPERARYRARSIVN